MKSKSGARYVAAVILSYAALFAAQRALTSAVRRLSLTGHAARVADIAVYAAAVIAAIAVSLAVGGRRLRNLRVALRLPETLAATASMIAFSIVFSLLGFGTSGEAAPSLTAAAAGIFIKPPLEEALFRGIYTDHLTRGAGLSPAAAIAATSILFAAWHPASAAPTALAAGVVLGILTHGVRGTAVDSAPCVLPAIAAHALYNAVMYASATVR